MDEIAVRKRLREIEPDLADPLTNPSDWAVLIEKHRLCIIHCEEDDTWTVFAGENCQTDYYESLPHAICLAIIEANGGMGDE